MKKRLLCLFLALTMAMSMCLAACSNSDDEEADVDEETGAQTITMRLVTEKKVCNTDEELAAYLKDECGGDAESQKYKDMLAVKADYDRIETAFSKITKSKYKINVDFRFYTEEEYYDKLKVTMEQYALDTKEAELASRALSKYISDYKAAYPEANYPDERLAEEFYKYFPEYEKYKNLEAFKEEDEDGEKAVVEEQYQENELGIQELVYPEAGENQLDIIYISGGKMYNEYIDNEWITPLDEYMSTTGKKLGDYITSALLNGVKVDGSTYAIPNNIQIGEYTYMLVNKELFDKYYHNKDNVSDVLDLKYFLEDVKTSEPNVIPLNSSFKECMDQFVWYWNIDWTEDDYGFYNYSINTENNFSLLGALYGDPKTAGRGQIQLGFNNLFLDEEYRNIYLELKNYEFEGYYAEADDTRENSAVSFMNADYSIKKQMLENDGVCTVDGVEYYGYVVKYPEADDQSLYGNMYAISANSSHTLACMQVITLLNTNSEVRNILQYGVAGEDYTIDDDTKALHRTNTNYLMDIEKTGNCFIAYPEEGKPINYWENSKLQNNDALIDPLLGFDFNVMLEEYNAELDNKLLDYVGIDGTPEVNGYPGNVNFAMQVLEKINSCTDYDELDELLNDPVSGFVTVFQGKDGNGRPEMVIVDSKGKVINFGVDFKKLTNPLYDTSDPDPSTEDESPDENGESPYAVYYNWMMTYGYVPSTK